jgi:beta-glucosidase
VKVEGVISSGGNQTAQISATVKNTGSTFGKEVIQVYLSSSPHITADQKVPKNLAGFEKVALKPQESRSITISLDTEAVAWYDLSTGEGSGGWRVDPGIY